MTYGELYIPPEPAKYNAVNGQFLKGHVPHNKGKKWSEYLNKRTQKRMAKGWKNLELYRNKNGRPDIEKCRKAIIAVYDDGTWQYFPFIGDASKKLCMGRENIGRCCRFNQKRHINKKNGKINTNHKYMGIRFYFESDDIWTTKIRQGY